MDQPVNAAAPEKRNRSPLIGLGLIAIVFALAAFLTWRKWPNLLVDFGMQLYVPWKISTGSVLYRDLGYLTGGPFSQYFNAALFRLFGVSMSVIIFANLLLAAGLITLIHCCFRKASNPFTATLIGLAIVLGFAFNQQSDIGNYNFITPYSHEVWHGLVLSCVAMALLARWVERERLGSALGAGVCAGLVFMTKPDVFVALMAGGFTALIVFLSAVMAAPLPNGSRLCSPHQPQTDSVLCSSQKIRINFLLKSVGLFLIAAALPLLAFAVYFHHFETWRESWRSVAFAWVPLLNSDVSSAPFYKWCLGLDAPAFNLKWMFIQFFAIAAVIGALALVFRRPLNHPLNRLLAVETVAALLALASKFNWVDCGRSLPLLCLVLIGLLAWNFKRLTRDNLPPVFPLIWTVFSFVLMAKLGLFPRVWHYGFALAMPAFVSAIYLLHMLVPHLLKRGGVNERGFRMAVALLILSGAGLLFAQSESIYRHKTLRLVGDGKGDGLFVFNRQTGPRDDDISHALLRLDALHSPSTTLAVLPEGIMINYLTRRTNPTHYFLWNPHELAAFGQDKMTADFEAHAPDYILLVHRDSAEYAVNYFGKDDRFGGELMRWVSEHYQTVWLIGDEPLQNNKFGIKLLRRKGYE